MAYEETRAYIANTVIPALRLAGYEVADPRFHFDWYTIMVRHAGSEDFITVRPDHLGNRSCVSLIPSAFRARASKFVIDRQTQTANLPGILATAKRLHADAKHRCEAAARQLDEEKKAKAVHEGNLPLLFALAAELGLEILKNVYTGEKNRVVVRGQLEIRASEDHVGAMKIVMDRRSSTHFEVPVDDARDFIITFCRMADAAITV